MTAKFCPDVMLESPQMHPHENYLLLTLSSLVIGVVPHQGGALQRGPRSHDEVDRSGRDHQRRLRLLPHLAERPC